MPEIPPPPATKSTSEPAPIHLTLAGARLTGRAAALAHVTGLQVDALDLDAATRWEAIGWGIAAHCHDPDPAEALRLGHGALDCLNEARAHRSRP